MSENRGNIMTRLGKWAEEKIKKFWLALYITPNKAMCPKGTDARNGRRALEAAPVFRNSFRSISSFFVTISQNSSYGIMSMLTILVLEITSPSLFSQ